MFLSKGCLRILQTSKSTVVTLSVHQISTFRTAKNKKMKGTGMWITEHPKFIQWNNTGGLLWIQGKGELRYLNIQQFSHCN
ncbi:hypothetical protein BT96DRAFT_595539 [Gymnopus androsaceus JB14]|uniref:Uncharacterized protein n=1 Tax=Gymnopus androsaceus JB14 TaxID=1447944 RepID=A0A6A4GJ57_9AGAR|nr:hypothetical protein BT96DRAFT_595539 [Gymnopus androsaceus JB14]